MGLYDILNNRGAGVLSEDQSKALYEQGIAHPQYQEMMQQLVNPRNMDTGMKLALLGQAMQGGDITGKITDYQSGIRERFRQRQQDKRQLSLDELEKRRTELGMKQTEQGMEQTQLNMDQSVRQFPLDQQLLRGQIAQDQQSYQQNATADAQWVGDHLTGRVMQLNKRTGQLEDVTHMYSQAQIEAFKASKKPAVTNKPNTRNPVNLNPLSEAEKARDKAFGKEIGTFSPTAISGNIATLNMVADLLEEPNADQTGLSWGAPFKSVSRLIDKEGDMGLRSIFDKDSFDTQEVVAGVIQKNLRETLGAQFTQREGMMLISRAYNAQLSPEMNAKRIRAASMLAQAYLDAKQKQLNYFNQNGTLAGYDIDTDGTLATIEAQVRNLYMQQAGGGSGSSGSGTTSTGVGFTVSAPQVANTP
tara:strand:- start:15073 stop:16323 length:1251 start_codon:yes stop_codon:yes gene_type:complete